MAFVFHSARSDYIYEPESGWGQIIFGPCQRSCQWGEESGLRGGERLIAEESGRRGGERLMANELRAHGPRAPRGSMANELRAGDRSWRPHMASELRGDRHLASELRGDRHLT